MSGALILHFGFLFLMIGSIFTLIAYQISGLFVFIMFFQFHSWVSSLLPLMVGYQYFDHVSNFSSVEICVSFVEICSYFVQFFVYFVQFFVHFVQFFVYFVEIFILGAPVFSCCLPSLIGDSAWCVEQFF